MNSHCSFPRERSGTTSRSSIGSVRWAGRPPCGSADRTRPEESTQLLTGRSRQSADVRLSAPFRAATAAPTQQHTSPPFTSRAAAPVGEAVATAAPGATAAKAACRAVKRGKGGAKSQRRGLRRSRARANSGSEAGRAREKLEFELRVHVPGVLQTAQQPIHAYARKGTTRTTHHTKIKLFTVYTLICTRTKTDKKDPVLETRGLACHVLTLTATA